MQALTMFQKWQQTHSILTVILEIFAKSHPDLRLGGELLLTLTTDRTVLTAADGFLRYTGSFPTQSEVAEYCVKAHFVKHR